MSAAEDTARALRAANRERLRTLRAQRPARKAALRERRAALAEARREARARVDANPEVQRARRRRRRRIAILVALLLALLALLSKCQCEAPAPPPVPPPSGPAPEVVEAKKPPPPVKKAQQRRPAKAKVAPVPRGDFDVGAQKPPPWLEELRLQVAARSPRLATCFANAEVPGALRWTASVNPGSGAVSDSTLEGNALNVVITGTQRACMMEVLRAPPFKLTPVEGGDALTRRVSLIVEF